MKLQLDRPTGSNAITACGDGYVIVNQIRYERSLLVMPDRLITDWAAGGFAGLSAADFETLRDLVPELVLIGTGRRQRFPAPAVLRPIIEARIGMEVMDLGAACRTYNILLAEGRRAAAALLVD